MKKQNKVIETKKDHLIAELVEINNEKLVSKVNLGTEDTPVKLKLTEVENGTFKSYSDVIRVSSNQDILENIEIKENALEKLKNDPEFFETKYKVLNLIVVPLILLYREAEFRHLPHTRIIRYKPYRK
jgi:Arc/MetJ-type ribon-helix-helix transcriptional regulator